ncbi:MAG: DNA mismatch repair protein MutT [Deltaproteobacteria bacterium]|nr:DNA mismatch repair protein MutT [Deltaproteobacteria bacterium]
MEFIYVVRRQDLFDLSFPQGFLPIEATDTDVSVATLLGRIKEKGFFVERRWAEQDSSLKQTIPYCMVTCGDQVLALQRLMGGAEARLHGKRTIGVGGHVNPRDAEPSADLGAMGPLADVIGRTLACAAWRELNEEVSLPPAKSVEVVGVVNDDGNSVGSVHFGLVLGVEVERPEARVLEPDQLEGGFRPAGEIAAMARDPNKPMETWSKLVASALA